ncbi:MAG: winged helix-turn-helix transcriptional regulator [Microbacterium sp.]|uniref:winged helix-turn-helix transcriptional regulator n=1 Tax=Microbacterium sp. TaxID=51671 RepID=UPI00272891CD|nr:winged helix-turn-helix transcriptional regulator [Microbacterium sp.]MDO8383118.1 winged helix-turn-helix transcriptional regulator [Microbacterium sp.]
MPSRRSECSSSANANRPHRRSAASHSSATGSASPPTYAARLASLIDHGVLERPPYQEPGQRTRHAYDITPADEELRVVMVAMQQWGDAHIPQTQSPRVLPVTIDTGEHVRAGVLDSKGRVVAGPDVAYFPASVTATAST